MEVAADIVVLVLIKFRGCVNIRHVSCKWIGGRVNVVKTVARASGSPRLPIANPFGVKMHSDEDRMRRMEGNPLQRETDWKAAGEGA